MQAIAGFVGGFLLAVLCDLLFTFTYSGKTMFFIYSLFFLIIILLFYFANRADGLGWHGLRLRFSKPALIDDDQSSIAEIDNTFIKQNGQRSSDESAANSASQPVILSSENGFGSHERLSNYNTRSETSQPIIITNMADLQKVITDVQPLLRDVQTLGPIIESVLVLSDSINNKINEYVSVGSDIANLLVTLKSQFNTVSTGGKIDFAALTATLNRLEQQVSVLIPEQQFPLPKY